MHTPARAHFYPCLHLVVQEGTHTHFSLARDKLTYTHSDVHDVEVTTDADDDSRSITVVLLHRCTNTHHIVARPTWILTPHTYNHMDIETGTYIPYHYIQIHTLTFQYLPLHSITYHYIHLQTITYHYISLHTKTYRGITLHYITQHSITLHNCTYRYIPLHSFP